MKKRTLMTTLMVAALLCGGAVVPAVQAHADTSDPGKFIIIQYHVDDPHYLQILRGVRCGRWRVPTPL